MDPTSLSLLDRLRREPDAAAWQRLHDLYQPLIRHWLARVPGVGDEADDLTQEVLVVLVRELPRFERRREGSFRAWLRRITVNRLRTYWRGRQRRPGPAPSPEPDQFLSQLEDPHSELSRQWDREHDQQVFQRLLATVQSDFSPTTWEAFQRFAVQGRPAAAVAAELGLSDNAVLLAKARVLKRLRQEAGDLIA
jgi:RNA polymerase sigma-70 factor (ECF subfamily)